MVAPDSDVGFRVLLVEDDDDHAELTCFHLQGAAPDATVERAGDGQQAIDYLLGLGQTEGAALPHLVLLDLNMPRLNGFDVLDRVRSEAALVGVPIVVLSTSSANADMVKSYERGANSYLVKPQDFEAFGVLLRDAIVYWRHHNRSLHRVA